MILVSDQLTKIALNCLDYQIDEDGYVTFYRFTETQRSFYASNSFFKLMSQCSSGVCLAFETDGNEVTLDCQTLDLNRQVLAQIKGELSVAEILQKLGETVKKVNQAKSRIDFIQHFDLYVDDHYLDSVRLSEGTVSFCLDNPDRHPVQVKIYFPLYKPLSIRSLSSNGDIKPIRQEKPLYYAFGDSITQGFVAGKPSFCYVAQLAGLLGVTALNQGVGNITHDPDILTDFENLPRPDLITVAYGTNDWHTCQTQPVVRKAVQTFYQRLDDLFNKTPTYVITPIWRDDWREAKECGAFLDVTRIIREEASDYPQIHLIDGLSISSHCPAHYSDGWLHPNIAGFSYMAMRLYRLMKDWQKDPKG